MRTPNKLVAIACYAKFDYGKSLAVDKPEYFF